MIGIYTTFCIQKPKSNPHCDEHYPYRSYDGSCNNLENYWWGAAGSSYKRLLPPLYDDGLNKMRQRSTVVRNARLPSARLISLAVHRERPTKSIWTNLMSTFSQLLSHDLSHFDLPANVTCDCHTDTDQDECYAVSLPRNDVHMRSHGLECIPFVRASARWSDKAECRLKPRTQWNDNSHFLDMDFVYANAANNPASRRFKRGLLATSRLANGELTFPRRKSSSSCPLNYDEPAYVTPDDDAEQNSYLFSAETLWLRNHNWLADGLARECSHWDDERLFQEARRINIAMYQHIVYDEYLPTLVGHKMAKKYDLLPLKRGYYTKYDRTLYPQISAEFAAAAFRLHTLVNHENCYADAKLQIVGCVDAQENTVTSRDSCESLDYVLRGLVARAGYEQTPQVNFALNNALLKQHDSLAVRDIQRGRDFGIPSYNEYRSLVGIKKATAFSEMKNIPKRVREQLERVYADVNDIDLWTGGMSEMALDDAVLGRTISSMSAFFPISLKCIEQGNALLLFCFVSYCVIIAIIARQFRDLKKGDRFFYENGHKRATRFKLSQLDELRDTYMAYVICQNVKVEVIPKNPFVIADDELNPILRCQDLKQFNFKLWSKNSS